MKTHTFYLTEAQRNNTAYYLGLVSTKLREEKHSDTPLTSDREYDRMIEGADGLQALFELKSLATSPSAEGSPK